MANKQAYKAKVQMSFVTKKENIEIEPSKIIYIIIEHMYKGRVMPVIYTSISVNTTLYSKLLDEKDNAKIFLRVQKYDVYSSTSVSKDYIKGQFTYFLPSTTPEYSKDLSEANSNIDSSYTTITIGLLDMDIMNTLRQTFGGIKKNVDQHTLIYEGVKNTNVVMKMPNHNNTYDNLIIPAISSRKKYLDYLFTIDPFYDTEFIYFIDFDKSYLLDETGGYTDGNDGQLKNVIIDIKSVTNAKAYSEGMEIKSNAYYFYVNPANVNVSIDMGTEKIANELIASEDSDSISLDLNINRSFDSDTKQTFKRMREGTSVIYKNAVESAQVVIELIKENIDSRYLTPNKVFTVHNYDNYTIYDGKYILLYKKEVIQSTGMEGDFVCGVTIGLKKLSNIQKIGKAVLKNNMIGTLSSKIRYTSSRAGSNYKNN